MKTDVQWEFGAVILLDALGTKGIYGSEDGTEYVKKLFKIHSENQKEIRRAEKRLGIKLMNYSYFSDTVIIVLKMDGNMAPRSIGYNLIPLGRFCDALFSGFFLRNIMVRGCISVGRYISHKGVIVGPAIDDAAAYYEKSDYIGLYCTPSTSLLLESGYWGHLDFPWRDDEDGHELMNYWYKYPVPLKGGSNIIVYTVNWPFTIFRTSIEKGLDMHTFVLEQLAHKPIPPEAVSKFRNTEAYITTIFDYYSKQFYVETNNEKP